MEEFGVKNELRFVWLGGAVCFFSSSLPLFFVWP